MPRPTVPHCVECDFCTMRPARGGGFHRACAGTSSGPPAPITNEARGHTSPDWCPRRHNYALFTFRWESEPGGTIKEEHSR